MEKVSTQNHVRRCDVRRCDVPPRATACLAEAALAAKAGATGQEKGEWEEK